MDGSHRMSSFITLAIAFLALVPMMVPMSSANDGELVQWGSPTNQAGALEVFTKDDACKDLPAAIERAVAAKKVVLTWEAARREPI